ncbi:polygalacturonase inhibitor-like [Iris pallida]|uniref:Polygalacturonase inhibitor-like n=1 Tax=Iris pallida TaxID=29817 RepID=A0AAX6IBZ1_IRIPA|nr:polygalacturonase inhibitor-like [Iris pallida]
MSILRVYLIFLVSSLALQLVSSQICNKDDSATLLKLKRAFNNPPNLDSWSASTSCCWFWQGVSCDDNGRVTWAAISASNISGPIPPEIGNLPELRRLEIEVNPNLTGPIPVSITKLQHLERLILAGNSISGTIPEFLCSMTSLNYIDLRSNKLYGQIPRCLRGSIYYIDFSSNRLSGHIPASLMNGYGGNDTFLSLANNRLTGRIPRSFDNINFYNINLSGNRLGGDASVLLGEAKFSTQIDVSSNRLSFDLSNVTYPEFLNELVISHNRIRGSINTQISELQGLGVLDMSYNRLCGPIPSGLWMRPYPSSTFEHNKCLCGTPLPPCT